jgi:hypothetical protein
MSADRVSSDEKIGQLKNDLQEFFGGHSFNAARPWVK